MRKSYRKDIANHPDPKSCGAGRKARHEALTGADAGEVSSREIRASESPTLLCEAEGNMKVSAKASSPADSRGSQTLCTHRSFQRRNWETPYPSTR
jgi:RNA-directed DNA polymerase